MRLSAHEVEGLQRRLAEIMARRRAIEARIDALDEDVRREVADSGLYEAAGLYLAGFREGARIRREALNAELAAVEAEEAGARDALAEAFESQKKYEQVLENAKAQAVREEARRETAVLDELGLRKTAR